MSIKKYMIGCLVAVLSSGVVLAEDGAGVREQLEEKGVEFGAGMTNVFQRNVKGGASTNDTNGAYSGSYDFEMTVDGERVFGLAGSLFLHGEGGWPDAEGIDEDTIGSGFGINADAVGNRTFDVVELFYEVPVGDRMTVIAGKLDSTGFFDGNAFANDEATQFLNGALVNNVTVPFPDYSIGLVAAIDVCDSVSVLAGAMDGQADGRETGLRTAFGGEDYFFYVAEAMVVSSIESANGALGGAYRFGVWYDPQPKAHSDSDTEYRDDAGFYASFDQMLMKEVDDAEDTQGLGGFFRFGLADGDRNDLTEFYSVGLQYQGLVAGRDDDVLGVGYANGRVSSHASDSFDESHEGVVEAYYSIAMCDYATVTPDVQYVVNPGASGTGDAVAAGVRVQIDF